MSVVFDFFKEVFSGSFRLFKLQFSTIVFSIAGIIYFFIDNDDVKNIMFLSFVRPFVFFFKMYIKYMSFFFVVGNVYLFIFFIVLVGIVVAGLFKIFEFLSIQGILPDDSVLNNGYTSSFNYVLPIHEILSFLLSFYTNFFLFIYLFTYC